MTCAKKYSLLHRTASRSAFTLAELLVGIAIVTLMATMLIVALGQVREDAREARTKAQIAKINELLMIRWESYRTRPIPLGIDFDQKMFYYRFFPGMTNGQYVAAKRLDAVREFMRLEMPDRKTDVLDDPVTDVDNNTATTGDRLTVPTLTRSFRRRVDALDNGDPFDGVPVAADIAKWTNQHQSAECLYMIIGSINDVMGNGLEFFGEEAIGDVDGDGMPEILDSWKNPIEFVRWPVGLSHPVRDFTAIKPDENFSTIQTGDAEPTLDNNPGLAADPMDYLHVDPRWTDSVPDNDPFALFPLIVSAGPDGLYDIIGDRSDGTPLQYSTTTPTNDPYFTPPGGQQRMGEPADGNGDNRPDAGYWDNITNHFEDIN